MKNLNGRKILLLCPKFYDYANIINNGLIDLGAEVYYYDERPSNSFLFKLFLRLNIPIFLKKKINNYYKKIIDNNLTLTDILVINPESLTSEIIENFKKKYKNCKFTLYMWDSVKNKKKSADLFNLFDKSFSFDDDDCNKYKNLNLEPLFYSPPTPQKINSEYDISFVGSIHSDRLDVISKVLKNNKIINVKLFLFSPSRLFTIYKLILSKNLSLRDYKLISHKKISINQTLEIFYKSKAIIDIHHPKQNGLTMRTFEALGSEKKLITTNKKIKLYQFYDDNNIFILNRDSFNLSMLIPFLTTCFCKEKYNKIEKQRIDNWLIRILQ